MATTLPLSDGHFLPRLVSVFFAVFHPVDGPKVLYQVPEGSITAEDEAEIEGDAGGIQEEAAQAESVEGFAVSEDVPNGASTLPEGTSRRPEPSSAADPGAASGRRQRTSRSTVRRNESPAANRPWKRAAARSRSRDPTKAGSRSSSKAPNGDSTRPEATPLFDFNSLSDYLIPKAPLCGRLVTCTTPGIASAETTTNESHATEGSATQSPPGYKILGHPMVITSSKYARNMLEYNLCFVFEGKADVRAYEPIVRKCARVLRDLELQSCFLSDPTSLQRLYGIVEQLFEDLNSYCESFVALPVLPHSLFGLREKSRWRMPPSFARDRQNSQQSSNGRSIMHQGGSTQMTPLSRRSSPPLSLIDHTNLTASLSSLVRGMPSSATVRGAFGGSSRNSEAGLSDGVGSDIGRSRSNSILASGPPTALAPLTLTPILEPAPSSKDRDGYFDSTVSPRDTTVDTSIAEALLQSAKRPDFQRSATITAASDSTVGKRHLSDASSTSLSSSTSDSVSSQIVPGKSLKRNLTSPPGMNADERSDQRLFSPGRGSISPPGPEPASRGLAESLLELRRMSTISGDAAAVEGVPLPGKREPPHGLGRTVRDAINVKLFPTYANPRGANAWDVPVALLDLVNRIDSDWDLTMAKIIPFIDGINHVKRIAQLADADIDLTRQCMEHLLYYGCIIMIDIFQFFNMYTVRPTIAKVADDEVLQRECAAYVTRPGFPFPDYPKLLQLYSALRPGKTIHDWIEEQNVDDLGIDPRRLVTFGVIKGFLRRVRRYPVMTTTPFTGHLDTANATPFRSPNPSGDRERNASRTRASVDTEGLGVEPSRRQRQASHQSDMNDQEDSGTMYTPAFGSSPTKRLQIARARGALSRTGRHPQRAATATVVDVASVALDSMRREEEDRVEDSPWLDRSSSANLMRSAWPSLHDSSSWSRSTIRKRPSTTSFGFAQSGTLRGGVSGFSKLSDEARQAPPVPEELPSLLDGTHHEDDLCVRFGVGWTDLETWLNRVGQAHRNTGAVAADEERDRGRWEDETPMMSGFQRPGTKSWRGGARNESREGQFRAMASGFMQWGLEPPTNEEERARSRSRERGEYGAVKLILM